MPDGLAGLAGELGGLAVEPAGQLLEAVFGQPEAVRAEGVRLDRVGAGLDVLAVDRRDELRPGQDQFVEAGALRDAARVEERAHRAVEQQRPAPQPDPEPLALGQRAGAAAGRGPSPARGEQARRETTSRWLAWLKPSGSLAQAGRGERDAPEAIRRRAATTSSARSRRPCAAPGRGSGPWRRC